MKSTPGTNPAAAESAPTSISQPQRRLLSHSFLHRSGSLTFLSFAESAPRKLLPSATAARTKLPTFRLGTYVGRQLTLQSEATSIRRPQRRTPTLPALPIGACNNLNVGRRTNLITSDVGRISDQSRDCLAIRNGGRPLSSMARPLHT